MAGNRLALDYTNINSMKQLAAAVLITVALSGCWKQHEMEPPIYPMYRQWFRIETPNIHPTHYRFYEDGTMTESCDTMSKTYTATLDGSKAMLQLGWNTRIWYMRIVEEDKLQIIEKQDTFIIVCK